MQRLNLIRGLERYLALPQYETNCCLKKGQPEKDPGATDDQFDSGITMRNQANSPTQNIQKMPFSSSHYSRFDSIWGPMAIRHMAAPPSSIPVFWICTG